MKKCRYLLFHIIQCVYFDTPRSLVELCPLEYGKAEIDRCRIESIYVPTQLEDVDGSDLSGLVDQVIGALLEDMVNPILIGSGNDDLETSLPIPR